MRPAAWIACLLVCAACGAAGDGERLLWPGQWHRADPGEVAWAYLAWDLRRVEPCQRIDPGAVIFRDGAPAELRSLCFTGVAANLRDPSYCDQVRSVRTLLHDGAAHSREACRTRAADPHGTLVGPVAEPAALLARLGWDEGALAEQCARAVERSGPWRQSFADSVARCAARSPEPECRAHAVRLAASLYFRDADAPCASLYEVDPQTLAPVARPDGQHDFAAWYRAKLRSGELRASLERLPDPSARGS